MGSKSLRRLKLPVEIVDRLATKNIKLCKDVLVLSPLDLLRLANCSYPQVQELFLACSQASVPQCINGLALKDAQHMPNGRFLSTSLPKLDWILHGGFIVGNISEITGPAGSGKTQFCSMISALVAITAEDNGEGGVLYFDTEGAFSAHRLLEIVESRCPGYSRKKVEDIVSRVRVIYVSSCAELMNGIEKIEEIIITTNSRLVVVDSVASLIRKEFVDAEHSFLERNNFITRLAAILKFTAQFFKIPVLTTNQITTRFGSSGLRSIISEEHPASDLDIDLRSHLTAALGNTWSHSVNTRLILQFLTSDTRQVLVAKSPVSPFAAINYTIQATGLVQQGDKIVTYEGTDPGEQRIKSRGDVPHVQSNQWSVV